MSMEYHLEQYRSMVYHCNDGNDIPIHIGPHEQKHLEVAEEMSNPEWQNPVDQEMSGTCRKGATFLFTIDATDTLHGAVQPEAIRKPGGWMKMSVILRAYRVALTKRLINGYGVKIVHTRDVDRALRMSEYDLDKSYEFAVKNIFSDLKMIMDEHRLNTSNMRDCRHRIRHLERVVRVERSRAAKDKIKLLNCLKEIKVEKKKLDLFSKTYQGFFPKANGAVVEQLDQFEKELKVKGKVGVTRSQLHRCLKSRFYDCEKAFSLAMSLN